jgi:hypothetical protein
MRERSWLRKGFLTLLVVSGAMVSLASACSGTDTTLPVGQPAPGTERGPCGGVNGVCESGLVCLSNVCVRQDSDAAATTDGTSGSDTWSGADTGTGTDSGGDAGPCGKTVPIAADTCRSGECYCATANGCFAAGSATQCCGGPVLCATADGGGNPDGGQCSYKHPIVDAGSRYCNAGECFCRQRDSCNTPATATACCPNASVTCY